MDSRPVPRSIAFAAAAATGAGIAALGLAGRRSSSPGGAGPDETAQRLSERGRGRNARRPTQIEKPGWKDIAWRVAREVSGDDLPTVARSIAFSGMLALFPALGAFVSIYGLFADVEAARDHLAGLTGVVPAEAMTLIGDQMVRLAAASQANLGFAFVSGVLLSVWSANGGVKALFKGLNVAYEERETRGFIRLNLVSLAFTLGLVLFLALAMAALVALVDVVLMRNRPKAAT